MKAQPQPLMHMPGTKKFQKLGKICGISAKTASQTGVLVLRINLKKLLLPLAPRGPSDQSVSASGAGTTELATEAPALRSWH